MDLQTQLKYVKYTYLGLKFFQLLFQLSFLFYLIGNPEKYEVGLILACSSTLIGALVCLFVLQTVFEKLFRENGNYCDYIHLIGLELTIFALALFTYPVAIYKIEAKYKHNKEKLYYAHHGIAPPELKVHKIDRNLRYLDEQTINEPIETTPKRLIDKALNMGEDLISFISTERTADIIAFSQNGKGPEYKTPSEHTNQDFEDYYDNYIHLNLALSLISIFVQFFIICTLLFGEYVKYRIKMQTTVQPPIEMAVIEGADGNAH